MKAAAFVGAEVSSHVVEIEPCRIRQQAVDGIYRERYVLEGPCGLAHRGCDIDEDRLAAGQSPGGAGAGVSLVIDRNLQGYLPDEVGIWRERIRAQISPVYNGERSAVLENGHWASGSGTI